MTEIWKYLPIQGKHSKYQVSNMGNLRKINIRFGEEMEMSPLKTCVHNGCSVITLRHNGKPKCYKVHRFVAEAFVDNPNGYKYVKHLDGGTQNNAASNLSWYPGPGQKNGGLFGVSKVRKTKIMTRTIDWLYRQLNEGKIECGNIEELIEDYKQTVLQQQTKRQ